MKPSKEKVGETSHPSEGNQAASDELIVDDDGESSGHDDGEQVGETSQSAEDAEKDIHRMDTLGESSSHDDGEQVEESFRAAEDEQTAELDGQIIGEPSNDGDGVQVGETSHPSEDNQVTGDALVVDDNGQQAWAIPLDVGQGELINALSDFFMDKRVHSSDVKRTLEFVSDLIERRSCMGVDDRLDWYAYVDYMKSSRGIDVMRK